MDARQGGTRRPSESLQPGQSNNHTSSPQFSQQSSSLDPINGASAFNQTAYGSNMQASAGDQFSFPERNAYLNAASQAPSFPQTTISSTEYRTEDIGPGFKRNSVSSQHRPSPTHLNIENSNHQFSSTFSSPYPTPSDSNFMLDPSLQSAGQPQNQSINPADLMGGASQSQDQNGSGQNLMQMDSRPSPHQSPSGQQQSQQHHFYSPNHSRHASLDPSSAGLPSAQPQGEWSGMVPYGHRRAPSEHSDVSSVAAPSPYLKQEHLDSYDQNPSPMLNPQPDPSVYQGALGIERFSISDAQQQRQQQHQQQQHAGVSPGHSPYPSPRMSPNQGLGLAPESQFILGSNDFGRGPGPQIYTPQDQNLTGADMTQASQMPPPEIQVDLAPPSRQMENGRNENDTDALSPPDRGKSLTATFEALLTRSQDVGIAFVRNLIQCLGQCPQERHHQTLSLLIPIKDRDLFHHSMPHSLRTHATCLQAPNLPAAHPPLLSQIAITSSISQTPHALHLATTVSASRNILQHSNAPSVPSALRAPTTSAPTFAPIPTSDPLCAPCVARPLHASTTASGTRACTQARRNSCARAICRIQARGVAGGVSRALMH